MHACDAAPSLPPTRTLHLASIVVLLASSSIDAITPPPSSSSSSSTAMMMPAASSSPSPTATATTSSSSYPPLAVATRLHLGNASHPPPRSRLLETLGSFSRLASEVGATLAIVAVDGTPKFEGYDLAAVVEEICHSLTTIPAPVEGGGAGDGDDGGVATIVVPTTMRVLPVTPWGRFVPALNAIVARCADEGMGCVLMASAEVGIDRAAADALRSELIDGDGEDGAETLVVGAVLRGHDYRAGGAGGGGAVEVELTGRTVPWNTCALWDVPKLALTGFHLVSEGLHPDVESNGDGGRGCAGIEEVATIAVLQRVLSPRRARAKLVALPGMVSWATEDFGDDAGRREWHERKMESKFTRARRQLDLLGLNGGVVIHC